jgi:putative membrane protein
MTPMMWGYSLSWGGMLLMTLSMLFWLGLLATLIWAIVRWRTDRATARSASVDGPSALEILQRRYARGEIDADTLDQMRNHLELPGQ